MTRSCFNPIPTDARPVLTMINVWYKECMWSIFVSTNMIETAWPVHPASSTSGDAGVDLHLSGFGLDTGVALLKCSERLASASAILLKYHLQLAQFNLESPKSNQAPVRLQWVYLVQ